MPYKLIDHTADIGIRATDKNMEGLFISAAHGMLDQLTDRSILKGEIKKEIHTNGIVSRFNWNEYFAVLASGDEVERVKPAPDLIRLALERLGAGIDDTVMIGDTMNDILAARTAGIKTIAIKSPFGKDDLEKHNPELILDDISKLPAVFGL